VLRPFPRPFRSPGDGAPPRSRDGVGAKQTVDSLRLQLDEVVKERDANRGAAQELAALKAVQDERERAFEERLAELTAAREALSAQFAEVGGKLLEGAQKQFLERADQRFRQSEETAGTSLKALLQPVHDRLQRYEEAVTKVEEERDMQKFAAPAEIGHLVALRPGDLVIFLPGEAHCPKIALGEPVALRKLVVKIPVALLAA